MTRTAKAAGRGKGALCGAVAGEAATQSARRPGESEEEYAQRAETVRAILEVLDRLEAEAVRLAGPSRLGEKDLAARVPRPGVPAGGVAGVGGDDPAAGR